MKVLIIGGTGNISRWISKQLVERGDEITIYNRGRTKAEIPGKVHTIVGDRRDYLRFEMDIKSHGPFDVVIDMVGYEPGDAASAIRSFKGATGQYIFCSTVDVYPKQQANYPVMKVQPLGADPQFPYAHKKMVMEEAFREAFEEERFPLTVIRPGATYSEGWSPLLTPFGGQSYHLDRLRKGKEMILHGDGSAIWSCCYAEDVARAFVNAAGNSRCIGRDYNVTGSALMTWRCMHETVARIGGWPNPSFVYIPTEQLNQMAPVEAEWCVLNFQYNNIYDSSDARSDLGFEERVPFEEGARRCLSFLEANKGIEDETAYPFYDRLVAAWRNLLLLLLVCLSFAGYAQHAGNAVRLADMFPVTDFGAVADGVTDNTVSFQRAVDSAALRGGRVYIPAGKWRIGGCIKVKSGVALVGTNEAPLSPYQLTGTVILATGGRDQEEAPPLFEMWNASTAKGFTVYYPDQQTKDIHPYPWTFYIRNPPVVHSVQEKRAEDFDVTIEAITLINSYNGIRCGPEENGRHHIFNVSGCVLRRGILVDWTGDVGRIENVHFHSHYWFHPATDGNWDDVFRYMQQHLEAFIFGRTDWEYVTNTFVFPARVGYTFIRTPNGACNGQFSGIGADATQSCIVAEAIQSQGLQITNGEFNSHHTGAGTQVIVGKGCEGNIRFTNCGFWGPAAHNVVAEGNSSLSFQNCYFSSNYASPDTSQPAYAMVIRGGRLQVQDCFFDGAQTDESAQWNYTGVRRKSPDILLEKGLVFAIITGNMSYGGMKIVNRSGRNIIARDNEPGRK
jgi:nucleoside-diphosphate-sugar epimerase